MGVCTKSNGVAAACLLALCWVSGGASSASLAASGVGGWVGQARDSAPVCQVVDIALVADYSYVEALGGEDEAVQDLRERLAAVGELEHEGRRYRFEAHEVLAFPEHGEPAFNVELDASGLLDQFQVWWQDNGDDRAMAHLFVAREDAGIVGLTWVGAACSPHGVGVTNRLDAPDKNIEILRRSLAKSLGILPMTERSAATSDTLDCLVDCAEDSGDSSDSAEDESGESPGSEDSASDATSEATGGSGDGDDDDDDDDDDDVAGSDTAGQESSGETGLPGDEAGGVSSGSSSDGSMDDITDSALDPEGNESPAGGASGDDGVDSKSEPAASGSEGCQLGSTSTPGLHVLALLSGLR